MLFTGTTVTAQVDIPLTNEENANFGVEADLYANVLDNETQPGDPDFSNTDDWFLNSELWSGSGLGVINVTGGEAPAKIALWDGESNENISDTLRQSMPIYSIVEGRTWIDALYARDQRTNGNLRDNSYFTSSSDKNFHDPETWTIGVGSGGPQKNDIIEFFGHIRRDVASTPGPVPGLGTEYAFLGATTRSQDGTSHLDFELFRNEIVREGSNLVSAGPECNRTAYIFDLAGTTGNGDNSNDDDGSVITHGDLIFSINYSKGGENVQVELFIWIDRQDFPNDQAFRDFNDLTDNPFNFGSASGAFNFYPCNEDPRYGYAQIKLATAEAQGWVTAQINQIETLGPAWGTFSGNGAKVADLPRISFIELSINATELGLDTGSTGGTCEKPLGTVLVKSRSSDSFTAELKDMLGPFPFGATPPVDVELDDEQLNCTLEFVTLEARLLTAGDFRFQWAKKNSEGVYEDIEGAISQTYDAAEPGFYKVMVTQILSNGDDGCTDEAEAEVQGSNDAPELVISFPEPETVSCTDDVTDAFNLWLGAFDVTGGGGTVTSTYTVIIDGGTESDPIDFANWPQGIVEPADVCGGGSVQVNLRASDECLQDKSESSTFTLSPITPGLDLPDNGSDTVDCPADAVDPGAPDTIQDACGNDVVPELVGQDDPSLECEGDVVWRYRYTECDGTTADWIFTYTIDYDELETPTATFADVACYDDIVLPTPPTVLDSCGESITPSDPVEGTVPDCEGDVTYTWTYTDCADNSVDYVHTVTIDYDELETPTATFADVACYDDIVLPTPPTVLDSCGESITPSDPVEGTVPDCEGDVTYTWTYTDCADNSVDYVHTVTIDYDELETPTATFAD
ncbi:hypothetical protein FGM01_14400, partial [Christiangramia sabulilitoris]